MERLGLNVLVRKRDGCLALMSMVMILRFPVAEYLRQGADKQIRT